MDQSQALFGVAEKMRSEEQRLGRNMKQGTLAMKVQAGCPTRQEGAGGVDCHLLLKTMPGPDQSPYPGLFVAPLCSPMSVLNPSPPLPSFHGSVSWTLRAKAPGEALRSLLLAIAKPPGQ